MRTMRIVFILLALCIAFSLMNCANSGADKSRENDGSEAQDIPAAVEEPDWEFNRAADKGTFLTPMDRFVGELELVESPVTMDDLVYPTYDAKTKTTSKRLVGDTDSWGRLTVESMDNVWEYYQKILEGWELEIDSKLEEEDGDRSVTAVVKDGDNVFTVELTQQGERNRTMIKITKEASSG